MPLNLKSVCATFSSKNCKQTFLITTAQSFTAQWYTVYSHIYMTFLAGENTSVLIILATTYTHTCVCLLYTWIILNYWSCLSFSSGREFHCILSTLQICCACITGGKMWEGEIHAWQAPVSTSPQASSFVAGDIVLDRHVNNAPVPFKIILIVHLNDPKRQFWFSEFSFTVNNRSCPRRTKHVPSTINNDF